MAGTGELQGIIEDDPIVENWYSARLRDAWTPRFDLIGYLPAKGYIPRPREEVRYVSDAEEIRKQIQIFEDIQKSVEKPAVEWGGFFEEVLSVVQSLYKSKEDVSGSLASIERAIEGSRSILAIEEDWDGEGSLAYDESTWRRATEFIRRITIPFITIYKKQIDPPKITAGPDGSIDVRWIGKRRTMLLNFPADDNMPPDFFGHDKGQDTLKGTLDLASQNHWLLLWLTR